MPHEKPSPLEMQEHFNAVSTGLILELKSPPHTDLTRSNLCHELTRYIARRLQAEGSPTQRELHADKCGNWHFVLNHEGPGKPPSDDDLITDFNPWQWGGFRYWNFTPTSWRSYQNVVKKQGTELLRRPAWIEHDCRAQY